MPNVDDTLRVAVVEQHLLPTN